MEDKVHLVHSILSTTLIPPSGFAASVWLNDVFLNTSYGKWVHFFHQLAM